MAILLISLSCIRRADNALFPSLFRSLVGKKLTQTTLKSSQTRKELLLFLFLPCKPLLSHVDGFHIRSSCECDFIKSIAVCSLAMSFVTSSWKSVLRTGVSNKLLLERDLASLEKKRKIKDC